MGLISCQGAMETPTSEVIMKAPGDEKPLAFTVHLVIVRNESAIAVIAVIWLIYG